MAALCVYVWFAVERSAHNHLKSLVSNVKDSQSADHTGSTFHICNKKRLHSCIQSMSVFTIHAINVTSSSDIVRCKQQLSELTDATTNTIVHSFLISFTFRNPRKSQVWFCSLSLEFYNKLHNINGIVLVSWYLANIPACLTPSHPPANSQPAFRPLSLW